MRKFNQLGSALSTPMSISSRQMIQNKHLFPAWALFVALLVLGAPFAQSQNQGNGDMLPPPMEATDKATTSSEAVPTVEYISEAEMNDLFSRARQQLRDKPDAGNMPQQEEVAEQPQSDSAARVDAAVSGMDRPSTFRTQRQGGYVPLRNVNLRLAYQNLTIEEIMQKVAEEINRQSGNWKVQWRLTETNRDIIEQRVNINAESNFDEFLSHLTAKINNLTGVRLFVKVFEVSRVIIIADTF